LPERDSGIDQLLEHHVAQFSVLNPFPVLSTALTKKASSHPVVIAKKGLLIVDKPYPERTKIFLLPILSDKEPETILKA